MKPFLAPILLMVLLFPTLALGRGGLDGANWDSHSGGSSGGGLGTLLIVGGIILGIYICFKVIDAHRSALRASGGKMFVDRKERRLKESERKTNYKNGKKHGPWVEHYSNGQIWRKGTYKDGKEHGPWFMYNSYRQLWRKETYKDGKKHGPWEEYHEWNDKGQISYKGTYKNGEQEGYWESYDKNGVLQNKRTFKDGNLDGPWEFYDQNGQLSSKETYKGGVKISD